MELSAEYVGPGGEPQRLRASCEPAGDADRLRGLSSGVAHMKELVAEFFGALARRDAQGGAAEAAATAGDVDGDEDDAEDENNTDNRTNSLGSSAKRLKPS
uniref:EKC/KEOPS complex subunit GON7-like n=1 Tax=Jaculus jaculus TaxID=51337 RepID=UPI001E1B4F1C|nr:EKC/KEOPS complex subunit GON7-like [Jaculus jaculus]